MRGLSLLLVFGALLGAQNVFPPSGPSGATSVGLSMPSSLCAVNGSPVTNTGTLTCSFATGQTANLILGTNGSGNVGLMNLTTAQLPSIASTFLSDSSSLVRTTDTGTVTNTMLAGSIANAKLTSSSLTIAGHSVALGGTQALASTDLSNASAIVLNNQANTYTAGSKQSVQASVSSAGFNFGGVTADPSSLASGDLWYRSDLSQLNFYNGSASKQFATVDQIPASSSPAQGYQPNQTLSGCGVEYTSGLTLTIGACTYTISGTTYTSALVSKTLATADPTNDRIDVIGVDNAGSVFVLAGAAGVSPQQPTVDPSTQLQLTFIYVPAAATTPQNITTDNLYDEGTEWTLAVTAHIANSTNNPYHLTHDLEATAAVLGNDFTLVKPAAGTIDLGTRNALTFYIRSKASWPTGASGGTAARSLSIFWLNGSTVKGNTVVLRDGQFGFSSANTTSYQQISIPTSLFGIAGIPVTTLEAQVSGPTGTSSIGWYVDEVTLQGGQTGPVLPATLMNFRGAWSSTTAYNANDTVVSAGASYVAIVANTNKAVTTTTDWTQLVGTGAPTGTGAPVLANTATLITPVIGAATGTSLLASGIVDGQAPITVTTGSSATLGGTYKSGYTFNENATAATAIIYTLPAAAAGLQYCVGNAYNGSAANTGTIEILTSASGQFIIFTDGTLSATGGYVISGGAAADFACVVAVDATHWFLRPGSGTWAKH